jgi:hypothetical protein
MSKLRCVLRRERLLVTAAGVPLQLARARCCHRRTQPANDAEPAVDSKRFQCDTAASRQEGFFPEIARNTPADVPFGWQANLLKGALHRFEKRFSACSSLRTVRLRVPVMSWERYFDTIVCLRR